MPGSGDHERASIRLAPDDFRREDTMPQLRLTYFDAPGRAEPIRVALHIAGLPFEDRRLGFKDFMAMKQAGEFPLGSVPVLEVDGRALPQTCAMLRYVARLGEGELYPEDPFDAFVVDSALDTFNDTLSNALTPSLFERDMEKKLAMRRAFAEGPMKRAFTHAEDVLGYVEGPFVLGDRLSIADLVLAQNILQMRSGQLDGITPDMLEPYPRLLALAEAYLSEPRIAAYRRAMA